MSMDKRAAELIRELGLQIHPEGGYFSEVFRSTDRVLKQPGGEERSALTTIYFMLVAGHHGRWHLVRSDEVWHYYEGAPLELVWAGPEGCEERVLGSLGPRRTPVSVVPANRWQAARTTGAYTLVGCTVGPGFEYADFSMLPESSEEERFLRERYPALWERVLGWGSKENR